MRIRSSLPTRTPTRREVCLQLLMSLVALKTPILVGRCATSWRVARKHFASVRGPFGSGLNDSGQESPFSQGSGVYEQRLPQEPDAVQFNRRFAEAYLNKTRPALP